MIMTRSYRHQRTTIPSKSHFKKVPSYWWDFRWVNDKIVSIIVESDHPDYEIVKEFPLIGNNYESVIEMVKKLISDLDSGRVSIKNV